MTQKMNEKCFLTMICCGRFLMFSQLVFYTQSLLPCFTGLVIALRAARKMKITKIMVLASLPYFEQWYESIPAWEAKNWCHGVSKNKGKKIANHELWREIRHILKPMDVQWVFNSKGATHSSVLKSAQSMALLPNNK